ncbi:E3 ubiquitin-protein ligase ZNF598-like isoform X2 [Ochotona curzoniae]|uniref:E3 ubiquitin-protein ligase ZNF598-like isoform X2 n=1 Tax=Ochotona curzoniae TaxID=130825 RepID=UPI001B34F706|nr:E3 ubiquitin-protein ligase ZNF598-like isoform X2 [Ochotona curzoniae]XP_040853551.1 E3 ubiquitin-protein ligase ZNF598-like isoform X2 [Ochotona curzoniae]
MAAAAGAEARRAAADAAAAPERGGGSCVLCCGDLEATALGRCDHPVCYRCSTKMRVLCEQRYCAVCREELRQVVFGKKLPAFSTISLQQLQHEKKYDIYFADGKVFALYRQLLQHECPQCPDLPPFGLFGDLEQHMRRQHELFCCKLCLKHLKIFTYERKWYSRKDLARHRTQGDPDDTSHRGHPLCKFCDERYLDNDELLKHLRRDHYFCHFCDADGAQDYYSDYAYLREHFREKHFLCEEGRCSTEQFTHAFRTEIDLKAHRTACHSRSRAEARQNRQIDLQFSYAPRHSRRNEGVVSGGDYEEVDRYNRQGRAGRAGGRGAQQSRRGSWRDEEEREVTAALRASVAMQQQEEPRRSEDRDEGSKAKRDEAATRSQEEPRGARRLPRPPGEGPGPKEASTNGPLSQEAFPSTGPAPGVAPLSSLLPPRPKLKEEDFPSLCASTSTTCPAATGSGTVGLALAYPAPARGRNTFQEEDFPALVSSASKPSTAPPSLLSAWNSSCSKKGSLPGPGAPAAAGAAQPPRKAGKGHKGGRRGGPPSTEEEEGGGITAQELRSTPTTVAVAALLGPTSGKLGKKKKVGSEKPSAVPSPPPAPDRSPKPPGAEEAPEAPASRAEGPVTVVNGHTEGPAPARSTPKEPPGLPRPLGPLPCPAPQEDFPALGGPCPPRTPPPPGFSTVLLLKGAPPPPPGLAPPVSKPPPGFSGLLPGPHPSCVPGPTSTIKAPRLTPAPRAYLIPENFRERNLQLIQSIKDFLQSDEARFSKFKSHSGEFRQGMVSAAQYYKSCRDLLGENFQKIFNELLVLLPDTAKQQELLSAHTDFRSRQKPPGTKSKKNKKSMWQASTQPAGLDCCVCPTCQQVLAQGDVSSHQALHAARDDDFPSLQAIARVIT